MIIYKNNQSKANNHKNIKLIKNTNENFNQNKIKLKMSSSLNNQQQLLYNTIIIKFILNLPNYQKKDISRLCYHCQKAYYYYTDCIINQNKDINDFWEKDRFQFFKKLQFYVQKINSVFQKKSKNVQSSQYINVLPTLNPQLMITKLSQIKPVCGAIIFNQSQTKVFVIKSSGKFGFPKGKWNQHEKSYQCAARQVQQETGLFIHSKIDPNQRVQFISRQSAQTIFFIVRGVSESQRIKVDKTQIDEVFWMKISDVIKYQNKFAQRSKIAWQMYLQKIENKSYKTTFEDFIKFYNNKNMNCYEQNDNKNKINLDKMENPLINFKFDMKKLMSVFN